MKKKALIVSNITKKFQAGHFSMITPLEELGYEVHWAANLSEYKENIEDVPCKVHHIDFIRNPFNPKNYKAYKQLMKLLKEENFEVIHCQSPIGGILGRICGKKAKVHKVIYTVHGFHFYKGAPIINNTLYKAVELFLAKYTDAIITINQEDYEYSKKMKLKRNGRSYYIPGIGVNTDFNSISEEEKQRLRESLDINEKEIVCVSVGELNKNKNNKTMIKSLAKSNNKNLKLLLCGLGPEEENLRKLAEMLGISEQVKFLGFRNDINNILAISDIFLLLSYREGLSRSIMEAMTAGLPCIVSKIRGNVDLIKDEELLFSPKDVEGFSTAIDKLAANTELRKEIGEKNHIEVKNFDIENVEKEMKKIYEEILSK